MRRLKNKQHSHKKKLRGWNLLKRTSVWVPLALLIFTGLPVWGVQTGYLENAWEKSQNAIIDLTVQYGFSVQKVTLKGRRYSSRQQIIRLIRLDRGQSIFEVNPQKIRRSLITLQWIKDAIVRRKLPNTIDITVIERRPVAIWQHQGQRVLVDKNGTTFNTDQVNRFNHLIFIKGEQAPKKVASLYSLLSAEPNLAKNVVQAVWIGNRRWTLIFRNGIRVRLPEKSPNKAWKTLARLNREQQLLARDVQMIDMRLPDRMIIKPGNFGRHTTKRSGHNT